MAKTETFDEHWLDADGNPAGGVASSKGVCISWQNGPLGRGDERREPNGGFVENVIAHVISRLEHYQSTKFNCHENESALGHLRLAAHTLNRRTLRRDKADIEGTHKED